MSLMQMSDNGFPRRARVDLMTAAERAIYEAVGLVETLGAHHRLTDAVILLSQARDAVADGVEALGVAVPATPAALAARPASAEPVVVDDIAQKLWGHFGRPGREWDEANVTQRCEFLDIAEDVDSLYTTPPADEYRRIAQGRA